MQNGAHIAALKHFYLQVGLVREYVSVAQQQLSMHALLEAACQFVDTKVLITRPTLYVYPWRTERVLHGVSILWVGKAMGGLGR